MLQKRKRLALGTMEKAETARNVPPHVLVPRLQKRSVTEQRDICSWLTVFNPSISPPVLEQEADSGLFVLCKHPETSIARDIHKHRSSLKLRMWECVAVQANWGASVSQNSKTHALDF